jgi:regulatory protein
LRKGTETTVRSAALHLLSAKAYTTAELRRKLIRKGFEASEIEATLSDFREKGYLNDLEYAARFTETRRKHAYFSKRMIAEQLKSKGVKPGIVSDVLDKNHSEQDEYCLAAEVAKRKIMQWSAGNRKETDQIRKRLYGFLHRRGFTSQIIFKVMRDFISTEEMEDEYYDPE